jgi:hypothetical protein
VTVLLEIQVSSSSATICDLMSGASKLSGDSSGANPRLDTYLALPDRIEAKWFTSCLLSTHQCWDIDRENYHQPCEILGHLKNRELNIEMSKGESRTQGPLDMK